MIGNESVWVIEVGYYEERSVRDIAATREAADKSAEALHPQVDHYFGMDPTCYHWQPTEHPESPGWISCEGCTVEMYENSVTR